MNEYRNFTFLGKRWDNLHQLCKKYKIPYNTLKGRLDSGMTYREAFLNDNNYEIENAVERLYNSGVFTTGEISSLLRIDYNKVKRTIGKLKNVK